MCCVSDRATPALADVTQSQEEKNGQLLAHTVLLAHSLVFLNTGFIVNMSVAHCNSICDIILGEQGCTLLN